MNEMLAIKECIKNDLEKLNSLIIGKLTPEEKLVKLIGEYILDPKGKRIRPLLTLLTSKMFCYSGEGHLNLAAAVEFIHAATLLHDDVVDNSSMRRSKPSAHILWGSKASILVGDFLFSQSFQLMLETESIPAMTALAKAATIISEGEVTQLAKLQEKRIISRKEYDEIIMAKTAELFGAACEVGARIANQPHETCIIIRNFGRLLGSIFQIIDDLYDYLGNAKSLGKNIGDDFIEGKVTLPLIILFTETNQEIQLKITDMIVSKTRSENQFIFLRNQMIQNNIKDKILSDARKIANKAYSLLEQIPINNTYKDHLKLLLNFTLKRSC